MYEEISATSPTPFCFSETVASSIAHTALDLKIGLLIVFTETGKAASIIAKYRPRQPIFVCSSSASVRRQMNAVRGVFPFAVNAGESKED